MIHCNHWRDCGVSQYGGGCCDIKVFKGTGSYGICLNCEQYTGSETERDADRKRITGSAKPPPKPPPTPTPQEYHVPCGVGWQLHRTLKKIGITPTTTCPCYDHALTMDANGIEWCEENITTIVDWMEEAAVERGKLAKIIFTRAGAAALVKLAIKRARKAKRKEQS